MKTWKEEVFELTDKGTSEKIDFQSADWKKNKADLVLKNKYILDAKSLYEYCRLFTEYAQSHSVEDWYNFINERSTPYQDLKGEEKKTADYLYKDAQKNIVNIRASSQVISCAKELKNAGAISHMKITCGGQILKIKLSTWA